MALSSYQFVLPKELIAQKALEQRDASRLMLIDRESGIISELAFRELADMLGPGDSLVLNNTQVIPARLLGKRPSGGQAEVFLLKELELGLWEAMVRPGRKLGIGERVHFSESFFCEIVAVHPNGNRQVKFFFEGDFFSLLDSHGHMPLPQYIHRSDEPADKERYQTVFASEKGAVAAPTAGLHFTKEMLETLALNGVSQSQITLHVGLGTFKPVQVDDIREHNMHKEPFWISAETADQLNSRDKTKRQICVGTTCCRALESSASDQGIIIPGRHETEIFIYPGYRFKYVESLLTNFHLPGSTLLMLTAAFAGYDLIMEAYAKAVKDRYRFFSYGDAMLII
ncbi:MAG: tRNA preQ1(34) S-adenosylmethionine ribosyltransferase-isomerase QueA [Parachlamydiaceae bacterium]|nr:tRNA preQ1(34) S-adenosylmethionine ribosyltransferase-isomerase QueA [Parachlamydiaceae bacterium]